MDKAELEAIDRVFCDKREDPLLVGSVMSNLGYVEAASGISAITKVRSVVQYKQKLKFHLIFVLFNFLKSIFLLFIRFFSLCIQLVTINEL